ncbi:nitrilase-related carbon-nitrogen hydrolase [Phyllobacterium sp. OV277]|uniref:nitrilase-related carbon-nitrogen hydrolase n=1 Tax=Phyllobacterium sp. OV277 TaxID=1882772 RepID=UPI00087EADE0|nr:nitrilase-related carbon-nitrogen hydrolase [Phyllobacterium sp. OV277]SDP36637.1 apolipoprotein N-acyltransferase [Phyllobacterium sp. OV277]
MIRKDHPYLGIVAATTTGLLFWASRDTGSFGPLVLIAPIPWLAYALTAERVVWIAALSFLAGTLGRLGLILAYIAVIPPAVLILWIIFLPLWFMGTVLLTRWLYRSASLWMALLAYPVFSTASEFLFNLISPHGSFGSLGYALIDLPILVQVASIGGVAALTFIGSLVPIAGTLFIISPRSRRHTAFFVGSPLIVILICGAIRMEQGFDRQVAVSLIAIDALQDDDVKDEPTAQRNAKAYADLIDTLAGTRPDIIVLPEKSLIRKPGWSDTGTLIRNAAERHGISIVAGFNETLGDESHANTAEFYHPMQQNQRYLKRRLIPGLESEFISGTENLIIGSTGIAICKDMDFAPAIRDYGRRGVQLMLVPAWDFSADARLHARMAVVRGVENGFAVVRAAANGMLTVSNAYGQIIAEKATTKDSAVILSANVGLRDGPTLYVLFGDVFGWLTVVGSVLLIIRGFGLTRKNLD